ncbi:hypothetical protein HFN97_37070 [Rhizobium laguerreae]|nr:hypothetical protein [Rhizobium laguerreae]
MGFRGFRGRLRSGASASPSSGLKGLRGGFVMLKLHQQRLKKQLTQIDY